MGLYVHYISIVTVFADKNSLAMGQTVTEDMKNKKSWDSNAITPGTPFMDLLASSLRYWVVQKMNTDPGWKQVGT